MKRNKDIYLTFDDGPNNFLSDYILTILSYYNYKATFFWCGYKAQFFKHLIPEFIKNGHKIGNHGYYHLNGWKTKTQLYLLNAYAFDEIYCTNLFRPPYGKITLKQWWHLRKRYKIVFWNYISKDYKYNDPEKILFNLKQHTFNGSIIVLHENEKTKNVLPLYFERYISWLSNNGFEGRVLK
ncbi:MAG: polysaccharide deacetylase family protein [Bacteroidales bacterium]|nr:polysaccharide deacetylase family protein [Bacteroidales bacterium]